MFAIYKNGSVGFRNTADNLYELKHIDAPQKASLKPDDDTLFQEFLDSKKDNSEKNINQNAINAYKKMSNIDVSEIVYHVEDIMTKNCICVSENASIEEAYQILKKHKVSQIPILSFDKKIIGIINKKTILNLLLEDISNYSSLLNKKLNDIYHEEVIATYPISDIRRVSKVMIDFKLDAIPVVNEEDVLLGIVSKTDIIRAVSHIAKLQLWS